MQSNATDRINELETEIALARIAARAAGDDCVILRGNRVVTRAGAERVSCLDALLDARQSASAAVAAFQNFDERYEVVTYRAALATLIEENSCNAEAIRSLFGL